MICKYKTEGRSLKDFRNHQNLTELFKDLRDCNITLKKVLKDQINLKSDLVEIKKGNPKSKLSKKNIDFLKRLFFFGIWS